MTFLMEKIKLSNYGKKSGKMNESFSNSHHHFYETEPVMGTENKNSKYNCFYVGKLRRAQNRLRKSRNLGRILPKLKPQPK